MSQMENVFDPKSAGRPFNSGLFDRFPDEPCGGGFAAEIGVCPRFCGIQMGETELRDLFRGGEMTGGKQTLQSKEFVKREVTPFPMVRINPGRD